MIISEKNKGMHYHQFNEYFSGVDDLKEFVKKENEFINTDSLHDDFIKVYEELSQLDEKTKLTTLGWRIVKQFGFKNKSAFKLDFWIERGYGIEEYSSWISKRRKTKGVNNLGGNNENNFSYGSFNFTQKGEPVCNLCKSKLSFDMLVDSYVIQGCLNKNCASHNKDVISIRQLAFLPEKLFINKNARVNLKAKNQKEYWLLKGLPYEGALKEVNRVKNTLSDLALNSAEYYVGLFGLSIKDAKKKVKQNTRYSKDFWLRKNSGLSDVEIEEKISAEQKCNSYNLHKKRSTEPWSFSAFTETQLQYWVNKCGNIEEGKKKYRERQATFSLEKCIEKYGEKKGKKKFTERQKKWQKSLNENGNLKCGFSMISQELFNELLKECKEKEQIYFATYNGEFKIKKKKGGIWLYDFVDKKSKKIIEYNGDDYHGNPKKYKADDFPHPFRKNITAREMWEKDNKKLKRAEEKGYEIFIVWDSEFRWGSKKEVINKCLNFLIS